MSDITDYYIYYKVQPEKVGELIPVAIAMQSDIYRLTGIRGRLKKKTSDGATWMEIYEGVHQRLLFEAALADCVARFGMDKFVQGGGTRKGEIFHDPLA
jgi:hypothetical protein